MANETQTLPGMLTDEMEFFLQGNSLKAMTSGKVIDFTEVSFGYMQILKDEIEADPEVKMELLDLHPNSEFKRLETFVKCRFGGLDYEADLSHEGIQKGEYWPCAIRGNCSSEGILCKAVSFNGEKLDTQDITLVQKLSTNSTNEVIAGEMHLPLGSFHLAKKKLYQKLGVQTKQESTIIAQRLNLI